MQELGMGKEWAEIIVQKLNSVKAYLKSDYLVHCKEESPCPDHRRHFALSDPTDKLLQESCDHLFSVQGFETGRQQYQRSN